MRSSLNDGRSFLDQRTTNLVVAWPRHRLTNAALEGNNSRIRGLSQRAHGYRNPHNFMTVLYHASWR